MDSKFYILIGFSLIFSFSFFFIFLVTGFFLKREKKQQKLIKTSLFLTLIWLFIFFAATIFATFVNIVFYVAVSALMVFGAFYLICEKLFGFSRLNRVLYSITLAFILNPVWIVALGVR